MISNEPSADQIQFILENAVAFFEKEQALSAMVEIGRAIEVARQLGVHIKEQREMFEQANVALQDEIRRLTLIEHGEAKLDALHDELVAEDEK